MSADPLDDHPKCTRNRVALEGASGSLWEPGCNRKLGKCVRTRRPPGDRASRAPSTLWSLSTRREVRGNRCSHRLHDVEPSLQCAHQAARLWAHSHGAAAHCRRRCSCSGRMRLPSLAIRAAACCHAVIMLVIWASAAVFQAGKITFNEQRSTCLQSRFVPGT